MAWFTALREHGAPVELVFSHDEGHVLTRPENQRDFGGPVGRLLPGARRRLTTACAHRSRPACGRGRTGHDPAP